jgi:hypothetical protein
LSTGTPSQPGVGSHHPNWSTFDGFPDTATLDGSLAQAAEEAKANGQIVVWDQSVRDFAVALYDEEAELLLPLGDAEAGLLLNRAR